MRASSERNIITVRANSVIHFRAVRAISVGNINIRAVRTKLVTNIGTERPI
jgi:hypothetical protein